MLNLIFLAKSSIFANQSVTTVEFIFMTEWYAVDNMLMHILSIYFYGMSNICEKVVQNDMDIVYCSENFLKKETIVNPIIMREFRYV